MPVVQVMITTTTTIVIVTEIITVIVVERLEMDLAQTPQLSVHDVVVVPI